MINGTVVNLYILEIEACVLVLEGTKTSTTVSTDRDETARNINLNDPTNH